MDTSFRWALLGIGAMTVVLLVQQSFGEEKGQASAPLRAESPSQTEAAVMLDRRLDVGPGGPLRVDVGDGDVEVRSGQGGVARVRVCVQARDLDWGREVFERMQFEVREEGDGLIVRSHNPRIRDYEWRDNRGVNFKIEITVPEEFDLDIRTSDGDLDIGNMIGRTNLRTSDGDVVLGALRGPEISIETSDGDIRAELLEAQRIRVETSDGDVDLAVGGGQTHVRTSDGDVLLNLLAQGEVEIHTGDGDITIYADPSLRADLELRGEVRVEADIQMTGRIGGDVARGKLNGGGPLLLARTGDGTITLRERAP